MMRWFTIGLAVLVPLALGGSPVSSAAALPLVRAQRLVLRPSDLPVTFVERAARAVTPSPSMRQAGFVSGFDTKFYARKPSTSLNYAESLAAAYRTTAGAHGLYVPQLRSTTAATGLRPYSAPISFTFIGAERAVFVSPSGQAELVLWRTGPYFAYVATGSRGLAPAERDAVTLRLVQKVNRRLRRAFRRAGARTSQLTR